MTPALPDDLPTLAARINEEHAACVRAASAALAHALDAGRMLIKAKSLLRHGEWADWLQANVPTIKPSTERLYRQLAEELPALLDEEDTVEDIAELSIRKARERIIARSRPQPRALPSPEAQPQNANPVSTIHEETPSASVPTSYPPPMVYKPMEEEEPVEEESQEELEEGWYTLAQIRQFLGVGVGTIMHDCMSCDVHMILDTSDEDEEFYWPLRCDECVEKVSGSVQCLWCKGRRVVQTAYLPEVLACMDCQSYMTLKLAPWGCPLKLIVPAQ